MVHGAWGGAWAFKAIDHALVEQGFKVYRPTLSGLGRDYHNNDQSITLQTHIADIVNLILFEKLDQLVLVGHNYGGMVISGVANALPIVLNNFYMWTLLYLMIMNLLWTLDKNH